MGTPRQRRARARGGGRDAAARRRRLRRRGVAERKLRARRPRPRLDPGPGSESMSRPPPQGGVMVVDVFPGSPAQAAGMEPGDVITRLNGKPVFSPSDVTSAIASMHPGQRIQLQYQGSGVSYSSSVPLGDASRRVSMNFVDPAVLIALLAIPLLIVWYVRQQRRRTERRGGVRGPRAQRVRDAAPSALAPARPDARVRGGARGADHRRRAPGANRGGTRRHGLDHARQRHQRLDGCHRREADAPCRPPRGPPTTSSPACPRRCGSA